MRREWPWIAGIVLATAILGPLTGEAGWVLAAALVLYAARHLHAAGKLYRALRRGVRPRPPFPSGIWFHLFDAVGGLQARNRKRGRRLHRFLSRFREAAAALPDAIVILGRDGEVEWFNPAATRLLGLARPGSVDAPVAAALRDPVFEEYLTAGDFSRPLEIASPGNRALIVSIMITPFGRKRQRLLVARDVTRVYHLDRARKDFVANVSHELRTPLTVLAGYLETLDDAGRDGNDSRRSVAVMRQQAGRMQGLIDDLLVLSRLEMADRPDGPAAVAVPELLASIVADARVLSAAGRHLLTLEADPHLWLQGSESELASAFSNLVFNAVRHTPPRTEIRVWWGREGPGASLSVSDTGEGIAERHIARLTEPFYRVARSPSDRPAGTGLGLAIVAQVLERHGGGLEVDSRVGKGSTFSCRFPGDRVVRPEEPPG